MSVNEQVFWLRGHPTGFALPLRMQWLDEAFVARYSGATARDSHPLPYSPQAVAWGTRSRFNHNWLWFGSKNCQYMVYLGCEQSTQFFRV